MQLRRAKIHFLNGVLTPSDEAINTARKELAEIAAREVKDAAKLGVTLTDQNRSLPPDAIVANWYFERNDFDNASRYAAAAFKANPKSYRVADLAVQICFIQDGKLEEARKIATDYLKNNPTDPKATILLGSIDLASKNYATAEKAFRSVVAQKPKDSLFVANDRLANTLYAQYEAAADKKAALPKIQEALKLAMENVKSSKKPNPQAVSTLAWGYYISGNQEAARRNFQAIVQSGRVMPDTAYVGAKMAFQDKNLQQAANLARQAAQSKVFFLHRQDAKNLLKRISEFETADISGSGTAARGQNKTQK